MRGSEYSLADIKAVTDGNNNNGFGGDFGAWWIIIIIILFGYGRGFGGYGNDGGSSNTIPFYQSLDTDFATIERKIDGVYSGICDATFSLNNTITNGNAAIQNTLTQGFAGLNTGMVQQGYENRIAVGNIGTQLADCCCTTQRAIDGVNYNLAKGVCDITTNATMNTRDIIENQNANYRALHDEIIANKLEAKNDRIAELNSEVNALRLKASQEAQNNFLIAKLGDKCPEPAYIVQPPQQVSFPTNCCNQFSGFNNGCGCSGGY